MSAQLARLFTRRGIAIRTGVRVKAVTPGGAGVAVEVEAEGKAETLEADQVLMAVGRAARTEGRRARGARRRSMEQGFVTVSPTMETSVKGIYAVGDMAGRQLLAHKAMAEGVVAAEAIAGPRSAAGGLRQRAVVHLLPSAGRLDRRSARRPPAPADARCRSAASPSRPMARRWRWGRPRAS